MTRPDHPTVKQWTAMDDEARLRTALDYLLDAVRQEHRASGGRPSLRVETGMSLARKALGPEPEQQVNDEDRERRRA